jgi:hypothetical protein
LNQTENQKDEKSTRRKKEKGKENSEQTISNKQLAKGKKLWSINVKLFTN